MPLSDPKKAVALDAAFVPSTTVYLSLHTASPATLANEFSGGTYGRVPVTVPNTSGGLKTFPQAGGVVATINSSGQTVGALGVCNTATPGTGTVDAWFDNTPDIITAAGDRIDINTLVLSIENVAGK